MRNDPSNETQEKIREAEEKRLQAKGVLERAGFLACGALDSLDERPARKGGKLCLGMECLDRGLWELEPVVAELARVGVFSARLQSGWARTETRKGAYDFSALDTEVRLLRESGITPWLSLSYGNPCIIPGIPPSCARAASAMCRLRRGRSARHGRGTSRRPSRAIAG